MRNQLIATAFALSFIAAPLAVNAQAVNGAVNGAAEGADEGADVGGPVGGVVGGAVGAGVGAAAGIVGGLLGAEERPRFRQYVVHEHRPSYHYAEPLHTGVVLPREGVTYYDVPAEYRVKRGYRYTVVNEHPVLVDPTTRRVVEVIE